MNPPASDAVQGAYLVAVVCTGAVFGGLAVVFKELTEGLGCLLGGFCFSMWLLSLKSGGLLTASGARSGFIAAIAVGSYAVSFSHHTRPYGLIASTAISGGTAFVLGVDCYSRAGLKEFWLYIWGKILRAMLDSRRNLIFRLDLNDDTFPLGTNTYPLTRNIRVELAAIIIVGGIGVISQIRLWKVVRQRRFTEKRKLDEEQAKKDDAEAEVGRRLQEDNLRERSEWEALYGRGPETTATSTTEVADLTEEWKKDKIAAGSDTAKDDAIEMDVIEVSSQRSFRCSECREAEDRARSAEACVPADETQPWHDGNAADEHEVSVEGPRPEAPVSFRFSDRVAAAANVDGDDHSDIAAVAGSEVGSPRSSRRFSRRSPSFRRLYRNSGVVSQSEEALISPNGDCDLDSNSSKEVHMDDGSEWSRDCQSTVSDIHHEANEDIAERKTDEMIRASSETILMARQMAAEGETTDNRSSAGAEDILGEEKPVGNCREAMEEQAASGDSAEKDDPEKQTTPVSGTREEPEVDDPKLHNEGALGPAKEAESEKSVPDDGSPLIEIPAATPKTRNEEDTSASIDPEEPLRSADSYQRENSSKDAEFGKSVADDSSPMTEAPVAVSGAKSEKDTTPTIDSEEPEPPSSHREKVNVETGSKSKDQENEMPEVRKGHDAPAEIIESQDLESETVSVGNHTSDTSRTPEQVQESPATFSSLKASSNIEEQGRTDTAPPDEVATDQKSNVSIAKSKAKAKRNKVERVELNSEAVKCLPERSSRIVQSYRTNEWAKHLADAETPGPEPITPLEEDHPERYEEADEVAAPVNMEELLQTPLNAQPPPIVVSPGNEPLDPNEDRRMSNGSGLQTNPRQLNSENSQAWKSSGRLSQISSASSSYLPLPAQPQRGSLRDLRSFSNPVLSSTVNTGPPGEDVETASVGKPKWTGAPPLMAVREGRVRSRLSLTTLGHDPWSSRSKPGHSPVEVSPHSSPTFAIPEEDEEDLPLSQRREMLQQQKTQLSRPSTLRASQSFSRREGSPAVMAAWRQSIREDLTQRRDPLGLTRSTSFGLETRQSPSTIVENTIAEGMQRGDMNDLHREAMRRMQAAAYRGAS